MIKMSDTRLQLSWCVWHHVAIIP